MNDDQEKKPVKKVNPKSKARELIVQALYQWQLSSQSLLDVLDEFVNMRLGYSVDKKFFKAQMLGINQELEALDQLIAPLCDKGFDEINPVELAILRQGVYELKFTLATPYKVVINESINLAKSFGATDGHRFINGVLDKIAIECREIEVKSKGRS